MFRKLLRWLALPVAFFLSANHAQCHPALLVAKLAPRLAIQHSSLITSKQLALLFSKGHNQIFLPKSLATRIPALGPAPLSLSAKAILLQYKTIVQGGFATGVEGLVTSGDLNGTLYYNVGGANYQSQFPNASFVFGNNPLNVGGSGMPYSGTVPLGPNFLSLKPVGGFGVTSVHGVLVPPRRQPLLHLSGSQRAFLNQDKALASSSAKLVSGGSLSGGEITGAFYADGLGNDYQFVNNVVFAFGNNPLNTHIFQTISISNPSNYLDFTGGLNRHILSGILYGTGYVPMSFHQAVIFALGNNPLNKPPFHDVFPTNFTSLLFF